MSIAAGKRGPSVLVSQPKYKKFFFPRMMCPLYLLNINFNSQVTDARDRSAPGRPSQLQRSSTRLITVDSVLQYASDIPSMQQRYPSTRPIVTRTGSSKPADPKLTGRMVPPHMPARSTKVSEKLVLLPETTEEIEEEKEDYEIDNEAAPPRDNEEELRRTGGRKGKSYAESLPKSRRAEKLARVTAYCTAQAYKLKATASFLKDHHGARTKLYDDCLYTVYHLPLLPGIKGYRIRSSPVLKSAGGKALLDEEIERNELRDYGEGFFEEDRGERFEVKDTEEPPGEQRSNGSSRLGKFRSHHARPLTPRSIEEEDEEDEEAVTAGSDDYPNSQGVSPADALTFAEMFVFSYGVVVFWNFSERQEKDVLADLTFSESETGNPLVTRALSEEDFETEEFHFEYSPETPRPRVFNDMITLRSGDHMIKLTISHAIAQSTKLCYFEQRMTNQMAEAQHVPRTLALTGNLGMKREEVFRIIGALFKSRVDVNLCTFLLFPFSRSLF